MSLGTILKTGMKLSFTDKTKAILSRINDEYGYWTDVKYAVRPAGISATDLWACVKYSRLGAKPLHFGRHDFQLFITDFMQRMCHKFDMNLGGYMGTQSFIPDESKNRYLVSSVMTEAIASSQMEGAATTRKVAKDMLRKGVSPRNRSEQMIYNNYATINYILGHKNYPFSIEQLLFIHKSMTDKTLHDPMDEGRFRTDDSVVVENGVTHEVVHTPPSHTEINELMEVVCNFFNDEQQQEMFIHPVLRGIIIHFLIGYIHPFADGNGRTARAVFYWYMLSRGYWMTEFLSISSIIAKSKTKYEKAYLHTECDQGDLGYFITCNLQVMDRAYDELRSYIQRKIEEKSQLSDFLRLGQLNERQAQILKWMHDTPAISFTVKELKSRFSITEPTVREDLRGLIEQGFIVALAVNKVKNNYVTSPDFQDKLKGLH